MVYLTCIDDIFSTFAGTYHKYKAFSGTFFEHRGIEKENCRISKQLYMKRIAFLFLSFVFTLGLLAQTAVITFEKNTHDFAKIKEQDGLATYSFSFKNTGDSPLVINRVNASCGCTTPNWTKEPILPGKTGTITASYNPAGRPGPFIKTISVFSNAGPNPVTLTIKGDVIPRPAVSRE